MNNELKECPFCGGEAALGNSSGQRFINCIDCLASTNLLLTEHQNTVEEAKELWNKRIKDAPTHSEFCKMPLEEGETVIQMVASNHHIAIVTNKDSIILIDKDGNARRCVRSNEND